MQEVSVSFSCSLFQWFASWQGVTLAGAIRYISRAIFTILKNNCIAREWCSNFHCDECLVVVRQVLLQFLICVGYQQCGVVASCAARNVHEDEDSPMSLLETEAKLKTDPLDEMDDISLGEAVRRARKSRGLSLQKVAHGVGISTGLLSQIERGISSPSVRNLRAICDVMGIPFLSLFADDEDRVNREARMIVRSGRRKVVDFGDRKMVKSFMTAHDDGALQVMEIVLQPGGGSGEESYAHEGEECGLVLSGRLELSVDEDRYQLSVGDAFHFESTRPHRFQNLADVETRVIWITTPPVW
jgi:transcriptional regulator with XRE-family HTH domain